MSRYVTYMIFIIMAIATVGLSIYFNDSGGTVLDESIVSAGAFLMLIFATVLQIHELSTQRAELNLTREEMKRHSEEFNRGNQLTTETLTQTKFFELLRLKEEYSNEILNSKRNTFDDFKFGYIELIHNKICGVLMGEMSNPVRQEIIYDKDLNRHYENYKNISVTEQESEQDYYNEEIHMLLLGYDMETFLTHIVKKYEIVKPEKFRIIFDEAKFEINYTFMGENFEHVDVKILKPYLKHKSILDLIDDSKEKHEEKTKEESLITLYLSQLHNDEKDAYKILNKTIEIKDIYKDYEEMNSNM